MKCEIDLSTPERISNEVRHAEQLSLAGHALTGDGLKRLREVSTAWSNRDGGDDDAR